MPSYFAGYDLVALAVDEAKALVPLHAHVAVCVGGEHAVVEAIRQHAAGKVADAEQIAAIRHREQAAAQFRAELVAGKGPFRRC